MYNFFQKKLNIPNRVGVSTGLCHEETSTRPRITRYLSILKPRETRLLSRYRTISRNRRALRFSSFRPPVPACAGPSAVKSTGIDIRAANLQLASHSQSRTVRFSRGRPGCLRATLCAKSFPVCKPLRPYYRSASAKKIQQIQRNQKNARITKKISI